MTDTQEFVFIRHPRSKDPQVRPARVTREAFQNVWARKGWQVVDVGDTLPSVAEVIAAAPPPDLESRRTSAKREGDG